MFKTIAIVWTAALVVGFAALGTESKNQPVKKEPTAEEVAKEPTAEEQKQLDCIHSMVGLMIASGFKDSTTEKLRAAKKICNINRS